MRIDVVSDLHVDMWWYGDVFQQMAGGGDVLVMAGDTGNTPEVAWETALEASKRWEGVLLIDGNHEHYATKRRRHTVDDVNAFLQGRCEAHRSIHWLNPVDGWERDGVRVLGTNGWYDFRAAVRGTQVEQKNRWMDYNNDAVHIGFGHAQPECRAERSARALQAGLEQAQDDKWIHSVVVVTHTIPRRGAPYNGIYATPGYDANTGAFVNTCMEQVGSPKLVAWVFGHTHQPCDTVQDGVRFLANPRGYQGERDVVYRPKTLDLREQVKRH